MNDYLAGGSEPTGRPNARTAPLSMRDFAQSVRSERERTDREESEFSLVAIRVFSDEVRGSCSREVTHTVLTRCRELDTVGWIDGQHLGVLLPLTCPTGSNQFIVSLARQFGSSDLPHCVFHYGVRTSRLADYDQRTEPARPPRLLIEETVCEGVAPEETRALEERVSDLLVNPVPLWKRGMDVCGATLALLLSSPIFLILAVYIKLVSPGPIFFTQERIGYKGRPFTFLKFRTMRPGNHQGDHSRYLKELIHSERPMEKLDEVGDRRIIPGGRIVRKACIDELPQFVNVLRGEMSLVGPRPCLPYEADEFRRWHANRFNVLPGITGPWQVGGKNKLTFTQMVRLDVAYCRKLSLWRDVRILLFTPLAILRMVAEVARPTHRCSAEELAESGPALREAER